MPVEPHDNARLRRLCNSDLLRALDATATGHARQTVALVAHVSEVDRRRLYAAAGYSSMYDYAVRKLKLAERFAYRLITAARLARRFPVVLRMLAERRMHMSGLLTIGPHLDRQNHRELLDACADSSRREIQVLVAERFPERCERPDIVRPVRTPGSASIPSLVGPAGHESKNPSKASPPTASVTAGAQLESTPASPVDDILEEARTAAKLAQVPEAPPPYRVPVSPGRYRLGFTVSARCHDKVQRAMDLMRHAESNVDMEQVMEAGLDLLLERLERRKFAKTAAPRPAMMTPESKGVTRTIPASVRRAVADRDGHRCTYVSPEGQRCESRALLEFDHVQERARGGTNFVENLRLRCRTHNQLEAEKTFGTRFMEAKRRGSI